MKRSSWRIAQFSIRVTPIATVVELPEEKYGSLEDEAIERVQRVLNDLVERLEQPFLVVDLSNVDYFAARFIGVLISTSHRLRLQRQRLAICGLNSNCAHLARVMNLEELFEIHPTLRNAFESIGRRLNHNMAGGPVDESRGQEKQTPSPSFRNGLLDPINSFRFPSGLQQT